MSAIQKLLQKLVKAGASDLHMSANNVPMWRLHGDMLPIEELPALTPEQVMNVIKEVTPEFNFQEFETKNDTDFAYEVEEVARFRVNVFRDMQGPCIVFRVIPYEVLSVEQLRLPRAVIELCHLPKGLVLVTGPTGTGKSTTLGAMVDFVNRTRASHIITIEDPIEFVHENKKCLINQREVHNHTDSFKGALRAALREDPDIILVGEMRDLETIETAIETAETGHLVFGTLHTTTAATTVERIIEQFPGDRQNQIRQMLANSLRGVVAQTLLKRRDDKGRIAAMEILIVTPAIANLIREGKTFQITNAIQTGAKQGMVLLNDALLKLVTSRVVTSKEAYSKAIDREDFQRRMAQTGMGLDISTPMPHELGEIRRSPRLPKKVEPKKAVHPEKTMQRPRETSFEPTRIARPPITATEDFKSFREKMFQKNK